MRICYLFLFLGVIVNNTWGLCMSHNSTQALFDDCWEQYPEEEDEGCAVSCSLKAANMLLPDGTPDIKQMEENLETCIEFPELERIIFDCIKEKSADVKPGLKRCGGYRSMEECFELDTDYYEEDDDEDEDEDDDDNDDE